MQQHIFLNNAQKLHAAFPEFFSFKIINAKNKLRFFDERLIQMRVHN